MPRTVIAAGFIRIIPPLATGRPTQRMASTREMWPWQNSATSPLRSLSFALASTRSQRTATSSGDSPPGAPMVKIDQPGFVWWISLLVMPS